MSDDYKPLFNRTYLTVLVWISALTVLFLSTMGDDEPDYLAFESDERAPVHWVEYETTTNELAVLLPTGGVLTSEEQVLQTLLSRVLDYQLTAIQLPSGMQYNIQQAGDHLALNFSWTTLEDIPDWSALFAQLNQPINPLQWQPVIQKLNARVYLQSHKVDNKLLKAYFNQLSGGNSGEILSRLKSRYQSMIAGAHYFLSGEDIQEVADAIIDQLPQTSTVPTEPRMLISDPAEITLPDANDSRYHLLIGNRIPVRSSPDFATHKLAAHSLQQALKLEAQARGIEYRLLWSALSDSGYQALILHSDLPLENQLKAIAQRVTEKLVKNSRNHVVQQWRERMSEEANQIPALKMVAFYGLPRNTLEQYPKQLADLEIGDVMKVAQESLQPQSQIRILFSAN